MGAIGGHVDGDRDRVKHLKRERELKNNIEPSDNY